MSSPINMNALAEAFKDEARRKKVYEAQMRAEWTAGEGRELALLTATHIRDALAAGARKADILRAIDRKLYTIVDNYIELLEGQPDHTNTEQSVTVTSTEDDDNEGRVLVSLHNYAINGRVFTGSAVLELDDEGDWLPVTEGDLTQSVYDELFLSGKSTILTRKWEER